MSAGKEIRNKIKSTENTKKITKAMEMVAASKMRKAQDRVKASRPYRESILKVALHMTEARSDYVHPYMKPLTGTAQKVGIIVVSSDKGLCGGLNTNVFRLLLSKLKDWEARNINISAATIGVKAANFVSRLGKHVEVVARSQHLGEEPKIHDLLGAIDAMTKAYREEGVDAVYLFYNKFVNTMVQEPKCERLLPLDEDLSRDSGADKNSGVANSKEHSHSTIPLDYYYEPGSQAVLDVLLKRYVESLIYQAVAENVASEQSARMVAMKAATDNAGNLISEFKLLYNKTRQAAITKELSEIVGGAAAV